MEHSCVQIQISPEVLPSIPSWFGEVVVFARVFTHTGMLTTIQEQVRFARARFGHYDLIDFVVVLIGYVLSGEPTLSPFTSGWLRSLEPMWPSLAATACLIAQPCLGFLRLSAGLSVVTRSRAYHLLDLEMVRQQLLRAPDHVSTYPESGMRRSLYDCASVLLTPTGPEVRLVVATHAGTSSSPAVGIERDGMAYELFVSTLPSLAFTASDVLDMYLYAARIGHCRSCPLRAQYQESSSTLKPRRVSAVLWPLSTSPSDSSPPPDTASAPLPSAPVLWRDWPRCGIRRIWLKVIRSQTMCLESSEALSPSHAPVPVEKQSTRSERAHWRLSWEQRLEARRESISLLREESEPPTCRGEKKQASQD